MYPKSIGRLLTAVLLVGFCSTAAAADVATIGWSDLIDEAHRPTRIRIAI